MFDSENAIVAYLRSARNLDVAINYKSHILYDLSGYGSIALERKIELAKFLYEQTKHYPYNQFEARTLTPSWLFDRISQHEKVIAYGAGIHMLTEQDKIGERLSDFVDDLNDVHHKSKYCSSAGYRNRMIEKLFCGYALHAGIEWFPHVSAEWRELYLSNRTALEWKKQALFLLGE